MFDTSVADSETRLHPTHQALWTHGKKAFSTRGLIRPRCCHTIQTLNPTKTTNGASQQASCSSSLRTPAQHTLLHLKRDVS